MEYIIHEKLKNIQPGENVTINFHHKNTKVMYVDNYKFIINNIYNRAAYNTKVIIDTFKIKHELSKYGNRLELNALSLFMQYYSNVIKLNSDSRLLTSRLAKITRVLGADNTYKYLPKLTREIKNENLNIKISKPEKILNSKSKTEVLIFGNDSTINEFDFSLIRDGIITCGVNRIWKKYQCDYLYIMDIEIYKELKAIDYYTKKTTIIIPEYLKNSINNYKIYNEMVQWFEAHFKSVILNDPTYHVPRHGMTGVLLSMQQKIIGNINIYIYGCSLIPTPNSHFWCGDKSVLNFKTNQHHVHIFEVYTKGFKTMKRKLKSTTKVYSICKQSTLNNIFKTLSVDVVLKPKYRVAQFKKSPLAFAPDCLNDAINKYSKHFTSIMKYDLKNLNVDLIHFHNKADNINIPKLIQYHSQPDLVNLNFNSTKLVLNQYQATLNEYKNCIKVKNIIDFNQHLYDINEIRNKIIIGYSPSSINRSGWDDKGTTKTFEILKRLKLNFPDKIEYNIINTIPNPPLKFQSELDECIRQKSKCNIIIDECVTGSFHRSGLEGLALGKMTFAHLSKELIEVFLKTTGSQFIPFENIKICDLYDELVKLIKSNNIDDIIDVGNRNRRWMETYWNPIEIIKEYEEIYMKELKKRK